MMPELNPTLLPCPFCGGEAKVERVNRHPPSSAPKDARVIMQYAVVRCQICCCCTDDFNLGSQDVMVKYWNNRLPRATRPDGGDSLREALLKLAEAMKPSGYWGQICAWIVNGAPTKNDGIDAAKYIVELQTMASAALAAKDGG